jgi:hypothetical protein
MLYESGMIGWRWRMDYEEILKVLAPCGMDCIRCLGYERGQVRELAVQLQTLLNGLDQHAERFSNYVPAFKKYPMFAEVLGVFAGVDCSGCRGNEAKYPHCGIDFCFQCSEYPCSPEGIDSYLRKRWLEMNDRMKEIGVEAYYEETKDLPRYR